MKRKFISFWVILISVLLNLSIAVSAKVTATLKISPNSIIAVETANTKAAEAAGNNYEKHHFIVVVRENEGIVEFHSDKYANLSLGERRAFMEEFLKGIKASNLGSKEKNSIYNFIASQDTEVSQALRYLTEDTSADLVKARKWISPVTGWIGTLTGVLSVLIFLFLGVGILIDLSYLAIPTLQFFLERGHPEKKPLAVSAEAWRVNKEVANDFRNTKNEITEYLKKRVPVILVCAICVGYLISGKIYEILTYFANAFGA